MPITELNPQEFAKTLAQQAGGYVPEGISEDHKKYITKKVYEFCFITGDHLLKQYKDQYTDEDAVVVVQFIGEWTFHKAIDLIRSGLKSEFWDTILQQVAFAALKSAIHAGSQKMDQVKTAELIENQVNAAFKQCIDHLVKANVIKEDKATEILSQSNVDKMAQESAQSEAASFEDDEKTLKYIAIALMFRKMPKEKVLNILKSLDKDERQKIVSCMQIKELEKKVEPAVINEYIKDFQKKFTKSKKPRSNEMLKSFQALQAKYGDEDIVNLTLYERPRIQDFLSSCLLEDEVTAASIEISPYILKILYGYLKARLA